MADVEGQAAAPEGAQMKQAQSTSSRASSLDLLLEMDEPEELAIALHKAAQEKGERWAIVAWHANEMVEAYKRANEPKR